MIQKNFLQNSNKVLKKETLLTGIQVNYFIHCKTQLWYFSHHISREQESELVLLGKLLHQTTFKNVKKDLLIDQKISIDFIKRKNKLILHDIKRSDKCREAHYYQMLYYLYSLQREKGIENVEGEINYPTKRKIIRVILTPEKEVKLLKILEKIKKVISLPKPPKSKKKKYCRKCSYFELCWI